QHRRQCRACTRRPSRWWRWRWWRWAWSSPRIWRRRRRRTWTRWPSLSQASDVTVDLNVAPVAGEYAVARQAELHMEEHIEVEGRILTVLAGTMFRVELDNKHQVLATISGKMRKRFVRLIVGDRVKMEMSPYDLNKARIVWRLGLS